MGVEVVQESVNATDIDPAEFQLKGYDRTSWDGIRDLAHLNGFAVIKYLNLVPLCILCPFTNMISVLQICPNYTNAPKPKLPKCSDAMD